MRVQIYFTANTESIEFLRDEYRVVLDVLKRNNCKNLNSYIEHCILNNEIKKESIYENNSAYSKSLNQITKSNFLIADVTYPSITVGRQIEYAIQRNIQVLCLKSAKRVSHISSSFSDAEIDLQTFRTYDQSTIDKVVQDFITKFRNSKVRLNFIVPREIENFLNWLSLEKKINKSEILRQLIEKEKQKYPKFNKS